MIGKVIRDEPAFNWRGDGVSRLEGFSDAVFGFSITLLIVSLEVPRTFEQLTAIIWGFPAFAASFVFLFTLWYHHNLFFRRYGMTHTPVALLNGLLLFLVLFFVYPVKFLASLVINGLFMNHFLGLDIPIGIERFDSVQYPQPEEGAGCRCVEGGCDSGPRLPKGLESARG
jgi:hypothetical protein